LPEIIDLLHYLSDSRTEPMVCPDGFHQQSPRLPEIQTPMIQLQKVELRRSLLTQRQSLPLNQWQQKSQQICVHLQNDPIFAQSRTILAYFSTRQEPDLKPLFTNPVFSQSHRWGFPRCVGKTLTWHTWSPTTMLPLQPGKFGILEPHADAPILEASAVDLILVPAVACDQRGYRLGYGGGFYDRLFSLPDWANKPAIGIVFDFAHLLELPTESWDYPLMAVCTEQGLFWQKSPKSGSNELL